MMTADSQIVPRLRTEAAQARLYDFLPPGSVVGLYSSPYAMTYIPFIQATIHGQNERHVAEIHDIQYIKGVADIYRGMQSLTRGLVVFKNDSETVVTKGAAGEPLTLGKIIYTGEQIMRRTGKARESLGIIILEHDPFEIVNLDEALRRYPYP
ncbi:MAG: hypothetical protein HY365_02085 [Candidatus Aenigmarchaeota archaeon]|nr:hypothetical protein [Candidatus Aenigmarchaeota archaeon]